VSEKQYQTLLQTMADIQTSLDSIDLKLERLTFLAPGDHSYRSSLPVRRCSMNSENAASVTL
jgi:hypothetical protein